MHVVDVVGAVFRFSAIGEKAPADTGFHLQLSTKKFIHAGHRPKYGQSMINQYFCLLDGTFDPQAETCFL